MGKWRRHPNRMSILLKCLLKESRFRRQNRDQRNAQRLVLRGYAEMVFRYRDIQFTEDYRMPREKFQVNSHFIEKNCSLSLRYTHLGIIRNDWPCSFDDIQTG